MANELTKDVLQKELYCGQQPAIDLLYARYGGMLYGYVLQFAPDKLRAESLLISIFSRLASRLQEACDSSLSIYCWLQIEARKIILDLQESPLNYTPHTEPEATYFSLLKDASPEHQKVFSELFLQGRTKEDLARQTGNDPYYVDKLLKESLLMIRVKLE